MTIFLKVGDVDDYGAMDFTDNYDAQSVYNEMIAKGLTVTQIDREDGGPINVEIIKFGDIDPAFISFMYDYFVDYDSTKSIDIFEVEEAL